MAKAKKTPVIDTDKKESESFNPDGAPRKELNQFELRKLARLAVTEREAASFFNMSLNTFKKRLDENPDDEGKGKLRRVFEEGQDEGRMSLRRMQFKKAQEGNTTMQVWLGKQLLGQREKTENMNHHQFDSLGELLNEIDGKTAGKEHGDG